MRRDEIDKFFSETCTPEERTAAIEYFKKHPSVLEDHLEKEGWHDQIDKELLPTDFWEIALKNVKDKNKENVAWVTKIKAAAAILIILFAGYFFYNLSDSKKIIAESESLKELKEVVNNDKGILKILLPDSTRLSLYPGAKVIYKVQFENDKRDIDLVGEAIFEVQRDVKRPFTVYSGDILTTALGTKFKVKYLKNTGHAEVNLYEGKVVVWSQKNKNVKENYLVAGESIAYHNHHIQKIKDVDKIDNDEKDVYDKADLYVGSPNHVTVNKNVDKKVEANATSDQDKDVLIPNWYKFEKEGLGNVLNQLTGLYQVKIEYDKDKIKGIFFIGKFRKNDSVEKILNRIADINDLTVEKINDGYFILK